MMRLVRTPPLICAQATMQAIERFEARCRAGQQALVGRRAVHGMTSHRNVKQYA